MRDLALFTLAQQTNSANLKRLSRYRYDVKITSTEGARRPTFLTVTSNVSRHGANGLIRLPRTRRSTCQWTWLNRAPSGLKAIYIYHLQHGYQGSYHREYLLGRPVIEGEFYERDDTTT
ncbi:hypothetical protein EVAR_42474_1 [Eumeta japonica]|uniref:Uncharacterized protein n=1 Tax=Eumeta variegata TaxID=151549 RepID=A0A4C1XZX8_EUMVA|nr:hypothetical protein EVAR_42474_1 [Eumeta japonica]